MSSNTEISNERDLCNKNEVANCVVDFCTVWVRDRPSAPLAMPMDSCVELVLERPSASLEVPMDIENSLRIYFEVS